MNILIINQPLNNRGDEAAHKGLIRKLVDNVPNINIEVLCNRKSDNTVDQFNVNLPQVKYIEIDWLKYGVRIVGYLLYRNCTSLWDLHPNYWQIKKHYKWANVVINAPGGICMGGFQNWAHLFYLKVAQKLHKPIIYYSRSIGPFPDLTEKNRRFKKISVEMLNYFSFCSLRDRKSERLAQKMNIAYTSTTDAAFLDNPNVQIPDDILQILNGKKYVVFVPNLLIWHYAYRGKATENEVIDFYSCLLNVIMCKYPDCEIIMLPQTFNYQNDMDNDINFFYKFARTVNSPKIHVIKDIYSSDIQQTIISKAECVIGARYHSVVFSLNQGVPFVALSYEHKIEGLLDTLGKKENMVDITNIFASKTEQNIVVEKFKEALSKAIRDEEARYKAKKIANDCFYRMLEVLNTKS